MAGRALQSIVVVCLAIVAPLPHETALAQPSTSPASPTTPPSEPAAPAAETHAQSKLARIWAHEPPLVRLARDRFGDEFSETDARFFAAVADNDWADFRTSPDAQYDATDPSAWAEAPVLKADRIEWLCGNQSAVRLVPNHGIWLRGAKIDGRIELYRCDLPFSLTMYDCLLDNGLSIEHARLQELDIQNSCSAKIMAKGAQVVENVYLNKTCVYDGLNFIDAQIGGDFDLTDGRAFNTLPGKDPQQGGFALNLHDAKVGGDVRLSGQFRAVGPIRLLGMQIGRSLDCRAAQLDGAGQTAIDAQRARVGTNVQMGGDFRAAGGVDLRRTHIGGDLDCDGGRFLAAEVDALNADLVRVGGQVHLGDGFHARGEVRLISAVVAGDVDCDNGHFIHPDGDALSLDSSEIGRSLRIGIGGAEVDKEDPELPAGFLARGPVRLWGTKIDQDILATGARLETPRGIALLAGNLRVANRVVLVAVRCQGGIHLLSAVIGRELDCRGSHIDASQTDDRVALLGDGMQVRGQFACHRVFDGDAVYHFRADGLVSVQFATIGMHWNLDGAELRCPGADALDASDCRVGGYVNLSNVAIDGRASFSRAKIDGMWILLNTVEPQRTQLDLRFAHIWVIKDERLDDWPAAGQLQLEGLVYDHFDDDSPLGVEDRLAWLRRQYPPAGTSAASVDAAARADNRTRRIPSAAALADLRTIHHRPAPGRVTPVEYRPEDGSGGPATMAAPMMRTPEPTPLEQTASSDSDAPSETMTVPRMFEPSPVADGGPAENATEPAPDATLPEPATPRNPTVSSSGRRYMTQPYTQLASVYRAIGQDEQANTVLVARAQRIGELAPLLSAQGLWYRYLGRLIGYGYEPFRAIKMGLAIVLVGTVVFAVGARRNLMAETKLAEHVLSQENEPRVVSATYPRFNPLVYSLDVFLPFVDLQQICYWLPGERAGAPRASRNCLLHVGRWSLKWSALLRTYFWFQTLAGWTLCTLLAAAVTGIVES